MNKKFFAAAILSLLALIVGPISHAQETGSASLDRIVSQIDAMFPPLQGYVIAVDGEVLTLDLKQGQPIKEGDRLKLLRFGKDIIHPVTKKKVGREEKDLGEVEILEVRKDFSWASATDPSVKAQPGDGVQSPFNEIILLVAPPKNESSQKFDGNRLRLNLEKRLAGHPRFQVPTFELGLWMLENGLDTKTVLKEKNLRQLRKKISADFIMVPSVRTVKEKSVLSYRLYSTEDGSLKKQAQVLSGQLPTAATARKQTPEQPVQSDFNSRKKGPIQFVGKHEFDFELVDFDIGDINGDGKKEYVIIDRNRVMVYRHQGNGQFKRLFQVQANKHANNFLGVDVGDINKNGRDEIFVEEL